MSNMRFGPAVVKVTQRISSLDLIRALCKIQLSMVSLENIATGETSQAMTDRHSGFRRSGFRRSGLDIGGLDVRG